MTQAFIIDNPSSLGFDLIGYEGDKVDALFFKHKHDRLIDAR